MHTWDSQAPKRKPPSILGRITCMQGVIAINPWASVFLFTGDNAFIFGQVFYTFQESQVLRFHLGISVKYPL